MQMKEHIDGIEASSLPIRFYKKLSMFQCKEVVKQVNSTFKRLLDSQSTSQSTYGLGMLLR